MTPFPRPDYAGLERYAPDRRPTAVDLSDNTNQWGPHPEALRVLRRAGDEDLTRYPSVYADALRDAIGARFGVPSDCVTTGCGSDDLLDSLFRAVTTGGGTVAYLDPTFSMIPIFARMNGMKAVGVSWDEALDDPDRVLELRPDLVYACVPNNPTGRILPDGWIHRLLESGGAAGPVVVLDEAYADFSGAGLLQAAPSTARLVVLRTLSKAYGLAGLRIGFGVGAEAVVAEIEKSRGPYKIGRLDERIGVRVLEDDSGWVEGIVDETVRNRSRLERALAGRGHRPLPSRANFLFLPVAPATAVSVTAGLRERGVAVRPFPGLPGIGDGIRVTIGPWSMMERFLAELDEVLPPPAPAGAAALEER